MTPTKKNWMAIFAIIIIGFIIQSFAPWWSIVIVTAAIAYFLKLRIMSALFCGFIASFLLWGVYAFTLNHFNEGILLEKISILFNNIAPNAIILVTALIGGIYGLLGGWIASWMIRN